MIAYRIPVLSYWATLPTNKNMEYVILCSDKLFYSINQSGTIEYDSGTVPQGETREYSAGEVSSILQNFFGDNVIMRNLPVYINTHDLTPEHLNDHTKKMFDYMGLRPIYDDYGASGMQKPTKVININDMKEIVCSAAYTICGTGYIVDTNYINYIQNICPFTGGLHDGEGLRSFTDLWTTTSLYHQITFSFAVFPEHIFNNGKVDVDGYLAAGYKGVTISITLVSNVGGDSIRRIFARGLLNGTDANIRNLRDWFTQIEKATGPATTITDSDNPYGSSGNSGTGGGSGHYGDIDSVDGTAIPDLPSISAADLGFITMYNPSKAQLKSLSDFLWSGLFDLDTYKKLFSDPMQSIIGLAIVPVAPSVAGSKNVMFGAIDSGVTMPYLSTQYVQFNCGSVTIEDYVGSFLDYSPYTKISIYLPYIGIHEISPDDIMNDSINVTYNIDVLSGACGAFISSAKKGVLYSYNGSCISNIPLTSINFGSAIQNAVSAVCSGAAMVAGIVTEAAPLTAAGVVGLLGNGANAALNSKPSVQRSGSLGGSAGVLSVQKPYIIIERPNVSVPTNVQKMIGQCSNITAYLGNLSGFTMVEYIHLEGIPATDEEIQEIEALLKEGVIL